MTPKEKAEELVGYYKKYSYYPETKDDELFIYELNKNAKQSALITVDEVLNELVLWGAPYLFEDSQSNDWAEKKIKYWQKVKQEIEKL